MVTLKEAKDVTNSIVKGLQPLSVVLFGSVAKEGTGNDLDLFILVDDTDDIIRTNLLLSKSLKRFYKAFDIDSFIIRRSLAKEYYCKGSPFLKLISVEGRLLYMKNAVQEWLKQSEEELDTAAYLLEGGYFKGACYHAQQAIEKAAKTLLFSKGWDLEKTHSMERLAAIAKDYKVKLNINDEEMVFIDNIYRGRYPIETGLLPLGQPSDQDAERAVQIARRMIKQAKAGLGKGRKKS
jgi:HEPN domain-containing protein